jgi:hypothetical protein
MFYEYGSWDCIQHSSFTSLQTNEPNKLEYFITLGRKSVPMTNTLADWAHL